MVYIVLIILIILMVYAFVIYNSLVKLNNMVSEAFSTMDVYLKKRWDLIPNIINSVKGYTKYESDTLKEIVSLRNKNYDDMSDKEKIDANIKLNKELIVLVEKYPDLKASDSFKELNASLESVEEDIANSRKYYNGVVRLYNNKVEMFPSNIIAKMIGYKTKDMFKINEDERENVKVEF